MTLDQIANQRFISGEVIEEPSRQLLWRWHQRLAATNPPAAIAIAGATTRNNGTVNHTRRSNPSAGVKSRDRVDTPGSLLFGLRTFGQKMSAVGAVETVL